VHAAADGLDAGAEALVRQRLPGGELEQLRFRKKALEGAAQGVRLPLRRRDDEERVGVAALPTTTQQRRDERGVQARRRREVGGTGGGEQRIAHRVGAAEQT
jgi:hypothetical protein